MENTTTFFKVSGAVITCIVPANQENFDTGIWLEAGFQYSLSSTGIWTDLFIDTGPEGFERWYMSPFKIFRRHKTLPWFALMGRINSFQPFLIGRKAELTPLVSGNLWCYANDVSGHFYKNNRGAIELKVVRLQ